MNKPDSQLPWIALIIAVLWLVGLLGDIASGPIHLLSAIAVVALIFHFIPGWSRAYGSASDPETSFMAAPSSMSLCACVMKDRACPVVGCFQSAIQISLDPELLTQPDTVFVAELWISESAHRASLEFESAWNSVDRAMRLL